MPSHLGSHTHSSLWIHKNPSAPSTSTIFQHFLRRPHSPRLLVAKEIYKKGLTLQGVVTLNHRRDGEEFDDPAASATSHNHHWLAGCSLRISNIYTGNVLLTNYVRRENTRDSSPSPPLFTYLLCITRSALHVLCSYKLGTLHMCAFPPEIIVKLY